MSSVENKTLADKDKEAMLAKMMEDHVKELHRLKNRQNLEWVQKRFLYDDLHLFKKVKDMKSGLFNPRSSVKRKKRLQTASSDGRRRKHMDTLPCYEEPTYLLECSVRLTTNLQTEERYLFLFDDTLIVAKGRSGLHFRLKNRIRMCEIWIASCLDEVAEVVRAADRSFVIGWPTINTVVTFESTKLKNIWMNRLKELICAEKRKETPSSAEIKISMKDTMNMVRSLVVENTESVNSVVERFLHDTQFKGRKASDFQLWVYFSTASSPYPLIGHEHPFSIWISNRSNNEMLILKDTDAATPKNSETVEFVIREKLLRRTDMIKKNHVNIRKIHLKSFFTKKHKEKTPKLFGQSLSDICRDNKLPDQIMDIMLQLYVIGPYTNGIFRKSVSQHSVQEVRDRLEKGDNVNIQEIPILIAATLFKEFLRNLPDCLLMSHLYKEWILAAKITDMPTRLESFHRLYKSLPACHQTLVCYVVCILRRISSHSETCSMTSYNLSVCVSQSLLWPTDHHAPEWKENAETVNQVIQEIIDNSDQVIGSDLAMYDAELQRSSLDLECDPDYELESVDDTTPNLMRTSFKNARPILDLTRIDVTHPAPSEAAEFEADATSESLESIVNRTFNELKNSNLTASRKPGNDSGSNVARSPSKCQPSPSKKLSPGIEFYRSGPNSSKRNLVQKARSYETLLESSIDDLDEESQDDFQQRCYSTDENFLVDNHEPGVKDGSTNSAEEDVMDFDDNSASTLTSSSCVVFVDKKSESIDTSPVFNQANPVEIKFSVDDTGDRIHSGSECGNEIRGGSQRRCIVVRNKQFMTDRGSDLFPSSFVHKGVLRHAVSDLQSEPDLFALTRSPKALSLDRSRDSSFENENRFFKDDLFTPLSEKSSSESYMVFGHNKPEQDGGMLTSHLGEGQFRSTFETVAMQRQKSIREKQEANGAVAYLFKKCFRDFDDYDITKSTPSLNVCTDISENLYRPRVIPDRLEKAKSQQFFLDGGFDEVVFEDTDGEGFHPGSCLRLEKYGSISNEPSKCGWEKQDASRTNTNSSKIEHRFSQKLYPSTEARSATNSTGVSSVIYSTEDRSAIDSTEDRGSVDDSVRRFVSQRQRDIRKMKCESANKFNCQNRSPSDQSRTSFNSDCAEEAAGEGSYGETSQTRSSRYRRNVKSCRNITLSMDKSAQFKRSCPDFTQDLDGEGATYAGCDRNSSEDVLTVKNRNWHVKLAVQYSQPEVQVASTEHATGTSSSPPRNLSESPIRYEPEPDESTNDGNRYKTGNHRRSSSSLDQLSSGIDLAASCPDISKIGDRRRNRTAGTDSERQETIDSSRRDKLISGSIGNFAFPELSNINWSVSKLRQIYNQNTA